MFNQQLSRAAVVGGIVLFLCALSPTSIHAQQETEPAPRDGFAERLGERIDRGIERLSSEAVEGWQALRRSVDRFGVQARVYSRLRWDKEIATAEIDVKIEGEGVVVLRGELKDPEAKRKAVELAEDTIGVQEVVDHLSVRPANRSDS